MKKLKKSKLEGTLNLPMSKTHIHRLLYASLLKRGISNIYILEGSYKSDDIKATINVLQAVGCKINYNKQEQILNINSIDMSYKGDVIYCNASATTLRIAIIVLLHLFGHIKLSGTPKLMSRPFDFYENLFENTNISFNIDNDILYVSGKLEEIFTKNPSKLEIKNCSSSQFITALMFIIPFYKKEYTLEFIEKMESVSYLEVTKKVLENYNIYYSFLYEEELLKKITYSMNNEGNSYKNKREIIPEIDYSSLAFWLVANELGANIDFLGNIKELDEEFLHPDQYIKKIIKEDLYIIDLKDSPDLLPILLVFSSFRQNLTKIINYQRNRIKEANRVENMVDQLNKIGANIKVYEDFIQINPVNKLSSGEINTYEDHRIAMAFAICSLKVDGILKIKNSGVVSKSYYDFWKDFESLGGQYE